MITWGQPSAAWALAAWAGLALALLVLRRRGRRARKRLADEAVWPNLAPGHAPGRARARLALWLAAWALAAAAFARPQWGFRWEEVRARSADWMVVLDVSNSMRAPDFRPSRFQQAQWALRDLVRRLGGDRIGLVVFAGDAFLHCPLTSDYGAFLMMLDEAHPGIIPRGGTAIARGLDLALEKLERTEGAVVVLITDGEDHEGDARAMARRMAGRGVKLHTIGVGTPEGDLVPGSDGAGFLKDREDRVVKSRLNEDLLADLARLTGGRYTRAAPGDFGLDRLHAEERPEEAETEQKPGMRKVPGEQASVFLLAALLLWAAEGLWPRRGRVRTNGEGGRP